MQYLRRLYWAFRLWEVKCLLRSTEDSLRRHVLELEVLHAEITHLKPVLACVRAQAGKL
jgi:hypothetical protein